LFCIEEEVRLGADVDDDLIDDWSQVALIIVFELQMIEDGLGDALLLLR
jgi:hypothetical protein